MSNDTRKSNIYNINYPKYVSVPRRYWKTNTTSWRIKWTKTTSCS